MKTAAGQDHAEFGDSADHRDEQALSQETPPRVDNDVAALLERLSTEIGSWESVPDSVGEGMQVRAAERQTDVFVDGGSVDRESFAHTRRPVRQFLTPNAPTPLAPDVMPPASPGAEPEEAADAKSEPQPQTKTSFFRSRYFSRGVKTAILLAVLIVLGWAPLKRLWSTTSAEASVNTRVITLRSPIDGRVGLSNGPLQVGAAVSAQEPVATIENPRANRNRLDDLRRGIADLKLETQSLKTQISELDSQVEKFTVQRDAFQSGRIEQLEAQLKEYRADIVAAKAEQKEAAAMLKRSERLKDRGYLSIASYDEAVRDEQVAASKIVSLEQKTIGTKVELDAARKGLYVGDSYNDIPRTAQRLDEINQKLVTLRAEYSSKLGRIAVMEKELVKEQKLYDALSSAQIDVPVAGRIWEVLTANHEVVTQGQPLFKVLDCGGAVVTATVSEATYNALQLGQPATFHLRGDSEELPGHVAALNGLADVSSNMALGTGIFSREPYHVTVAVPGLGEKSDCYFGRTGKVTFDTSAGSVAAPAASAQ